VFIGATAFAALRVVLVVVAIWRQYGREFRVDVALWREQLAYALPFALAVGVEVIQQNYHQYVVASRFDAATFAIYAVGCLQIPLVDMIMTSTVNVMMVKMAEDASHGEATVGLWHETICRLAFLMVPLSVFLFVIARELILTLYTTTYAASIPIFMVWALTILPSIFAVNAVLRVFAETRFLLVMNLLRLAMVAALIGWFLSTFGMSGAVLVTLVSTLLVNIVGVGRIAHLLHVPLAAALPWGRLAGTELRHTYPDLSFASFVPTGRARIRMAPPLGFSISNAAVSLTRSLNLLKP
jgi:O-antigen/teichoic acid export membrane protein